ncbi:hypothetical protein BDB01DRAFT_897239 [Pilobolus umbonatus]|nr:hypothetical protein BDB01DRAFT_897239 [Pilobolus umbonatus]
MFSSDSSLICHMSDVLFMSATVCCLKKGVTIFTSLYCKTSSGVLQVYISSAFITEGISGGNSSSYGCLQSSPENPLTSCLTMIFFPSEPLSFMSPFAMHIGCTNYLTSLWINNTRG